MSRSQTNPLRMQDQQEAANNRQPDNAQEADPPMGGLPMNNEMEALRLVNQRLLKQNEELLKFLQRPHEAR